MAAPCLPVRAAGAHSCMADYVTCVLTVANIQARPSQPPLGDDDHGTSQAPRETTILIVDDDDCIRDSLAWLLEGEGFSTILAANGVEALAALARSPLPSLALIDLRMPVMNGIELIEALRADRRWSRLPIVVLSAASTIAPPAGVPILAKPISAERLLSAMHKHLAGRAD